MKINSYAVKAHYKRLFKCKLYPYINICDLIQHIAGECFINSSTFTETTPKTDNPDLQALYNADLSYLKITFTDYIFAPKKVKGQKEKVNRWYIPTKQALYKATAHYLRQNSKYYEAMDNIGDKTAYQLITEIPDFINRYAKLENDSQFNDFLATLKKDDDKTLLKHFVNGLTVSQTAEKMQVSQPAITQRFYRIAEKYRQFLNTAYTK